MSTRCSLIQALRTLRSVFVARAIALLDGVLEALGRCRTDLGDTCDSHGVLLRVASGSGLRVSLTVPAPLRSSAQLITPRPTSGRPWSTIAPDPRLAGLDRADEGMPGSLEVGPRVPVLRAIAAADRFRTSGTCAGATQSPPPSSQYGQARAVDVRSSTASRWEHVRCANER